MRAKWWHGKMKVTEVFGTHNRFSQYNGRSVGICTVTSLRWAKATLERQRTLNGMHELPLDELGLQIEMAKVRRLDSRPREQTEHVGLRMVLNRTTTDLDVVLSTVKRTAPYIAIFWTAQHTMGYRYAHHTKEFFDIEEGLFRSKYTDGIKAKIEANYAGQIRGFRVVALP